MVRKDEVSRKSEREEIYRRLEQVQRHVASASDSLTRKRMTALVEDLQQQLAVAEASNAEAPPTEGNRQ
jgi:hypothetical protein